jgi:hypothetical protein
MLRLGLRNVSKFLRTRAKHSTAFGAARLHQSPHSDTDHCSRHVQACNKHLREEVVQMQLWQAGSRHKQAYKKHLREEVVQMQLFQAGGEERKMDDAYLQW